VYPNKLVAFLRLIKYTQTGTERIILRLEKQKD